MTLSEYNIYKATSLHLVIRKKSENKEKDQTLSNLKVLLSLPKSLADINMKGMSHGSTCQEILDALELGTQISKEYWVLKHKGDILKPSDKWTKFIGYD